jgi:hypothetical protein
MVIPEDTIRLGAQKEVDWGKIAYGEKHWAEELWGKVVNDNVTLFHGTSEYLLEDISRCGLQPSYAGHGYDEEEIGGLPEVERPVPSVWLAYTPYLAFFFGDVIVQVTIPLSWITEANDGVLVEQVIPPAKIDRYLYLKYWK